jgi:hypothetical protein
MPTLTLDGIGSFSLDDSFNDLSDADKQKTIEEIAAKAPRPQPQAQPDQPTPDTSFTGAFRHGAADVTRGVAQTFNLPNSPVSAPGLGKVLQDITDTADVPNYQPADPAKEFAQGHYLGSLREGLRGLTENAGNVAAYLGLDSGASALGAAAGGPLGEFTGPAAGAAAMFGMGTLQSLGPLAAQRAIKQGHVGPDGSPQPTDDDWHYAEVAAGAQGAVMASVGKLAKQFAPQAGAGLGANMGRLGAEVGLNTGAMTTGNLIGQTATSVGTPGGIQVDPGQALQDAAMGATAFAVPGAARGALRGAVDAAKGLRAPGKAGEDMRAYADAVQPWADATQDAAAKIKAANPGMSDEEVQQAAEKQATQAGVESPTYDTLSPKAQNGLAELSAIQLYQARRQAETEGMGRDDTDMTPGRTFKGVMDDIATNLNGTADALVKSGLLTKEQASPLYDAISEARRHNRQAAENGSDFGYFDTFRDRVNDLPIDQAWRNQIMLALRTLDIASANSLEKRSKGPLETLAKALPTAGLGAGIVSPVFGGLPGIDAGAGWLAGRGLQALLTGHARALDQAMGTSLPPVLRRANAITRFAADNNLPPVADPRSLQAMQAEMMALRNPVPPPPAGQEPGPVTASGRYPNVAPTDMPSGAPQEPTQAPGGSPATPPAGAPSGAAQQAPTAPSGPVAVPPAPRTLTDAMQTMQQVLDARAGRLGALAQSALPSGRTGWTNAMANTLGVQHDPMMERLRASVAQHPELASLLDQPTIPRPALSAFTNHLADLRDAGQIPLVSSPRPDAPQPGSGVRNPMAYQANLNQEASIASNIASQHPELTDVVNRMRDPVVNGKTKDGRAAVLDRYLSGIADPAERTRQEAILGPLAAFGQLAAANDHPAPTRGMGASPRAPRDTVNGGLGFDPTARRRGNLTGPQVLADRRFKRDVPAPGDQPGAQAPRGSLMSPDQFQPGIPADQFHAAIAAAKEASPNGAAVTLYDPEDYNHTRNFLTPDGKAGFALRGQDIVSVFKHPDSPYSKAAQAAVTRAVQEGGRTLDAFDPQLPKLYGDAGMKASSRLNWDESQRPPGWRSEAGTPDVVLMHYDPSHGPYKPGDGPLFATWDEAATHRDAQMAALDHAQGANGGPPLEDIHPLAASRAATEAASLHAQQKARAALASNMPVGGENSFLLHQPLTDLMNGKTAQDAGVAEQPNMVALAKNHLMPAREESGVPQFTGNTDEDLHAVSNLVTKEAVFHLAHADNALGWYDHKLRMAMDMMSRVFPEFKTDGKAAAVFKGLLAITSNGNPVDQNFKDASREYERVRQAVQDGDYRLPDDMSGHPRAASWNTAARRWNLGVQAMGFDGFMRFLETKAPARELSSKWSDVTGVNWSPSKENKGSVLYGATILGPKIGNGFFSNLNGRFDMPTQDLWFSRTIGRLRGVLVKQDGEAKVAQRMDDLQQALRGIDNHDRFDINPGMAHAAMTGDPEALKAAAAAITTATARHFRQARGNSKPQYSDAEDAVRLAGQGLSGSLAGSLTDTPTSGGAREFNRQVINRVRQNLLDRHGIDISAADLQALLWYPEQRFWQRYHGMGNAKTDSDYMLAAGKMLAGRGLEDHIRGTMQDAGHTPEEASAFIDKARKYVAPEAEDDDE